MDKSWTRAHNTFFDQHLITVIYGFSQALLNRLLLRFLWASQSLFKVKSAPPWPVAGTERLPTGGNQLVKPTCSAFSNVYTSKYMVEVRGLTQASILYSQYRRKVSILYDSQLTKDNFLIFFIDIEQLFRLRRRNIDYQLSSWRSYIFACFLYDQSQR